MKRMICFRCGQSVAIRKDHPTPALRVPVQHKRRVRTPSGDTAKVWCEPDK
jgi:hypothetical protein